MPPDRTPTQTPRERQILRPAQLNALARDLLEGSFPMVWVEAEISNLSRPASGHLYFTLKDDRAQIRCALFRQKALRLSFQPGNGQQVLARGRLTLYEPRGDYQLVLDHLEPAGEGALRAAYEALRTKLAAEGLFAAEGKPSLPRFVRRLGVITSPRGAAVRDVISVLSRRFPLLSVEILPVPVQGEGAAAVIARTLEHALASGRFDALLLTRGGGSLEDLWAFNDEALVRSLAAARVPVVAAIGHEIDVSLAEFAAALRAPTPSAAAELLVPDQRALLDLLAHLRHRHAVAVQRRVADASQGLDRALMKLQSQAPGRRLERGRERLAQARRHLLSGVQRPLESRRAWLQRHQLLLRALHPHGRLRDVRERLARARARHTELLANGLRERRQQVDSMARALHALGPLGTLDRGYAILRDADSGELLRDRHQFQPGQTVSARLNDGEVLLRVSSDQADGGGGSGTG